MGLGKCLYKWYYSLSRERVSTSESLSFPAPAGVHFVCLSWSGLGCDPSTHLIQYPIGGSLYILCCSLLTPVVKAPTSCLCLQGHLSWTGGKADRSPTATEAVETLSQAAGSLSRRLTATSRLATSRLPSGMERHGWVHSACGPCTSLGSPEKQNQQKSSYLIDRYIDTQIDTKT